jgi:hypothetical protein
MSEQNIPSAAEPSKTPAPEPSKTASAGSSTSSTPEVSSQPSLGSVAALYADREDPITLDPITDPVMIKGSSSKMVYNRQTLVDLLKDKKEDPITHEKVSGEIEEVEPVSSASPFVAATPAAVKSDPTKKEVIKSAPSATSSQSSGNQKTPVNGQFRTVRESVIRQSMDRRPARSSSPLSSVEQPKWIAENLIKSYAPGITVNKKGSVFVPITVEKLKDLIGQDINKMQQLKNGKFCHENLKHIEFSRITDDTDKKGQYTLKFKNCKEAKEFFSYFEDRKDKVQNNESLGDLIVNKIKNLFEVNHQNQASVLRK